MTLSLLVMLIALLCIVGLLVWVALLYRNLRETKHQANRDKSELAQERQRASQLESERDRVCQRASQLENERNQLQNELDGERQYSQALSKDLKRVAESNQEALWFAHLLQVSLQSCGSAFTTLTQHHRYTVGNYQRFRDEVEKKARQRLVKRGAGAILSLVPGVGALQLLGDLGEILEIVTETGEGAAELSVEELADASNGLEDTLGYAEVQEAVAQHLDSGEEPMDQEMLDAFVKDTVQRAQASVSPPADEGVKATEIAKTVNKFRQFSMVVYDYHKDAPKKAEEAGKNEDQADGV